MYEVMENPNIVLPDLDAQLDWEVAVDGTLKPLRFLNAADLSTLEAATIGPQATAYARVRRLLDGDREVEDIGAATFLAAFWGESS